MNNEFINANMAKAKFQANDNPEAFYSYKNRNLFPPGKIDLRDPHNITALIPIDETEKAKKVRIQSEEKYKKQL